jgi:integrase
VNPNRYWQKLNAILRKNNIEELGFHKLRHIYSSLTSDLGIDSQVRMENGGWSNEHIMNGTYRHSLTEAQLEANTKMNAYVNKMVESNTKSHTDLRRRLKLVRFGA